MFNQEAHDTFWFFINERHKIYLKKIAKEPKPWTKDPIFQNWKFCNVFRKLDKQTKWLIDHIIERGQKCLEPDILLFNIFAFRAFNWYPTYSWLTKLYPWIEEWDSEEISESIKIYLEDPNNQLSSGAYMLRGREGMPKQESIIMTLSEIWQYKQNLLNVILAEPTIEHATRTIIDANYWGWGPFTAYQIALDLTYSNILPDPEDINTWCQFGPGAQRGMKLIFPDIKNQDMLAAARGLLLDSPKFLEPHVPDMNLQDIEFSLCELQKYMRIKSGGKGKEKYVGV